MPEKQFFKFIVIGLLSTVINYGVFYALYEFFSIYYILSSAIGFITGVFAGYGLNKTWTFGVKNSRSRYIHKYCIVYIFSLFLGLGFLNFLVTVLDFTAEFANILTIGLTTCTNFMGIKLLVFKK